MEDLAVEHGKSLKSLYLPQPTAERPKREPKVIARERFNPELAAADYHRRYAQLNEQQKEVCDRILGKFNKGEHGYISFKDIFTLVFMYFECFFH